MKAAEEKSLREMILQLGLKYQYEKEHADFVDQCSSKIFECLWEIHRLDKRERILLSHASLVHDIGNYIHEKKHHKHTKYIIDHDDIFNEYPARERKILSLVAYNHRNKIHKDVFSLPRKEEGIVLKLSAILRVADALHYTREDFCIENISVERHNMKVGIKGVCPEGIVHRLDKKKQLFHQVFCMDIGLISSF